MKFLADMGISPRTVEWLRNSGYDAKHLIEEKLEKLTDEVILEKGYQEKRVILTLDLDFGYLLAISGAILPSVIVFRLTNPSVKVVNQCLDEVMQKYQNNLEEGAIISVKDKIIKVRQLPINKPDR